MVVTTATAGLTSAEVVAAHARGDTNTAAVGSSRSYTLILRTNLFTLFNNLLFGIGIGLLLLDRTNDAVVSVGLGLINAVISSVQEIRAKRKLDHLKLLNRGLTRVTRDGTETEVPPEQIVRGDLIHLRAGDQAVVDGPLTSASRMEFDESLLTGESHPVGKHQGDQVLSGSSCLSGDGHQRAQAVGAASHAQSVTTLARGWTVEKTPLQRRIHQIVRAIMLTVALMSAAILAHAALEDRPVLQMVQNAAVLSGLIPYGLFLLVAVAYTTGAASLARRGALVQQVNAVEALSNVDVLCTDKTGTLTTGRLRLEHLEISPDADPDDVRRRLASMAHSVTAANSTTAALAEALPGHAEPVHQEVPFSSTRRWSAVNGYLLGAPDRLLPLDHHLRDTVTDWAGLGYRVLVFAHTTESVLDPAGEPRLPPLHVLALVVLRDELRPHVQEVLRELQDAGVAVKVVSGDDPRTVAALAGQIGLNGGDPVSGTDLEGLTRAQFDETVNRCTVFGRIAPQQKQHIIEALRRRGHYTAMIGDGVNDIPSLKQAHVGVAMQSGSAITRDIAHLVLLDNSFAALTTAREHGRHIISGITTSMNLFLARVATSTLIIVIIAILGLGFPYEPAQVALTLFTVGLPTFFLTRWAQPRPFDPHMLTSLTRFVGPASLITACFAVTVYATQYKLVQAGAGRQVLPAEVVDQFSAFTGVTGTNQDFAEAAATISAQTALSTFTAITAFILILFLCPPVRFFAGWTSPVPDKRPALLVLGLFAVFLVVLLIPPLANYFGLLRPDRILISPIMYSALPLWFFTLRATWRYRLLDRLLGAADT